MYINRLSTAQDSPETSPTSLFTSASDESTAFTETSSSSTTPQATESSGTSAKSKTNEDGPLDTHTTVHKPVIPTSACCLNAPHSSKTSTITHARITITGEHTTFTFHPHPVPSSSPSDSSTTRSSHHQSAAAILFEVIGGLTGLAFIIGCSRCVYKYKRTPRQDRIAAVVDRHLLERELAALEEAQEQMRQTRRNSLVRPPPPPYQRAPEYEEVICQPIEHPP